MTTDATTEGPPPSERDRELLSALLRGDEQAFATLVDRHGGEMLRVALLFVSSRAVAEEVVQETWLNALRGLRGFQGRSSLKTWLFTILANTARRRAAREARSTPFSSFDEPGQFFDESHPRWAGAWSTVVPSWDGLPDDRLLADETRARIELELQTLPEAQRLVFTLRDIEGWDAEEVCNLLALTDSNQRVILHRARLRVRAALERWLTEEGEG